MTMAFGCMPFVWSVYSSTPGIFLSLVTGFVVASGYVIKKRKDYQDVAHQFDSKLDFNNKNISDDIRKIDGKIKKSISLAVDKKMERYVRKMYIDTMREKQIEQKNMRKYDNPEIELEISPDNVLEESHPYVYKK